MSTWKAQYAGVIDSGHGAQHSWYTKTGQPKGYAVAENLQAVVQSLAPGNWCQITKDDNWMIIGCEKLPEKAGSQSAPPVHPAPYSTPGLFTTNLTQTVESPLGNPHKDEITQTSMLLCSVLKSGAVSSVAELPSWVAACKQATRDLYKKPQAPFNPANTAGDFDDDIPF